MATTVTRPQAVSGVSAGVENEIETSYPSIAASTLGKILGRLMNLFPGRICGIRISHILLAPIVIPLALVGYVKYKFVDPKYVLTNRSIQVRGNLTNNLWQQVALADIDNIAIIIAPGQEFYHAGNLELVDARGETLLVLDGVPYPQRLRQIILDARDARLQNDAALKAIEARG
jgi:hypothetical protein